MKKTLIALSMIAFLGSAAFATSTLSSTDNISIEHNDGGKDKKKKKKCAKDCAKECCTADAKAEKKSCSKDASKSCCKKKATEDKK